MSSSVVPLSMHPRLMIIDSFPSCTYVHIHTVLSVYIMNSVVYKVSDLYAIHVVLYYYRILSKNSSPNFW